MDRDFMQWLAGLLGAYSEGNLTTEYSDMGISEVFYTSAYNRVSLRLGDTTITIECTVH